MYVTNQEFVFALEVRIDQYCFPYEYPVNPFEKAMISLLHFIATFCSLSEDIVCDSICYCALGGYVGLFC